MKKIVRLHVFDRKLGREVGINDSNDIIKRLNKVKEDTELDYLEGGSVKMGTSRELIGETVMIGEDTLEIRNH